MIPGVAVQLRGRDFIVPPLTLGQLRRLGPKIDQITAGPAGAGLSDGAIAALVEVITAALHPNYPELTAEEVEELLDLSNSQTVLAAVLTGSGLKQQTGDGPGEASAVSIGATSTASSPPPADTATAT